MLFKFAYAGIPEEFYGLVSKHQRSIVREDGEFYGVPMRGDQYRSGYSVLFTHHFARLIQGDNHNTLSDSGFAVICVQHEERSTEQFRLSLFPSVLVFTVNWVPNYATNRTKERSANELVDLLRQASNQAKAALKAIFAEVQSRANRTPLLLPVKNFNSPVLTEGLRELQENLFQSEECERTVRSKSDEIAQVHLKRAERTSPVYFLDDRNIIYRPPGNARHGFARPDGDHPPQCILAGRRRLGAPYDRAFHYDCTRNGVADFIGLFFTCHEKGMPYHGKPHINIAPNDFIRI